MKTLLSFFTLFSLIVFLLPLAALNPDKTENRSDTTVDKIVSSAVSQPIRQEEVLQSLPSSISQSTQNTLAALQVPQPEYFSILDRSTGQVEKVAVLDYLYGAVAAELPPGFHLEAMKAQAVASHTYALYCQEHPSQDLGGADFSADPSNWEGYVTREQMLERYPDLGETYWEKIKNAVDEVASTVLVYQEEPILAAYHSMSAGATEFASNVWNGTVPYLIPVDSVGDTLADQFETSVTFASEQIKGILTEAYPDLTLSGGHPQLVSNYIPLSFRICSYITGRKSANQWKRSSHLTGTSLYQLYHHGTNQLLFIFDQRLWTWRWAQPIWCRLHGAPRKRIRRNPASLLYRNSAGAGRERIAAVRIYFSCRFLKIFQFIPSNQKHVNEQSV